jgi:ferredoxin-NADP reductase
MLWPLLTVIRIGNCPKYLNRKTIVPAQLDPTLVSESRHLPQGAIDLLNNADTLFISSSHHDSDMDTNFRGGPRGFIRILSNDTSGAVLIYPEYSGNRLYQTLGNLQTTPLAGLAFPDFETGNVLYVTGETEVLVGKDAANLLPRSNLAVKVTVTSARYVEKGLPFRGEAGDPSPYNPSVRYLPTEKVMAAPQDAGKPSTSVTLVKKIPLTPSINRFRFRVSDANAAGKWIPGQYATLSFEDELDMGYSHMRDDDPTSLNDDYIRTFTVSSYPGLNLPDNEFEITVRKNGRVTEHLFRSNELAGVEAELRGFGGSFKFEENADGGLLPFVAGGIGITPVIAQLPGIDISRLRLFWSLSVRDIGVAFDTFRQFTELPKSTVLFLTGLESELADKDLEKLKSVSESGARIERRRMEASDLDLPGVEEWYLCAGTTLKATVLNWLTGKRIIYEDFNY